MRWWLLLSLVACDAATLVPAPPPAPPPAPMSAPKETLTTTLVTSPSSFLQSTFLRPVTTMSNGYVTAEVAVRRRSSLFEGPPTTNHFSHYELLFANGMDWTAQPLTGIEHKDVNAVFQWPRWFSNDLGWYKGVCVGDFDNDGYEDLFATALAGPLGTLASGGVLGFRGTRAGKWPEPSHSWRVEGFAAAGCTLADVNGDGWLDLVVASMWEKDGGTSSNPPPMIAKKAAPHATRSSQLGPLGRLTLSDGGAVEASPVLLKSNPPANPSHNGPPPKPESFFPPPTPSINNLDGRGRVFLNDGTGQLRTTPWVSEALGAADVASGDVDGDGFQDVVFAGQKTKVFWGPFEGGQFSGTWTSDEGQPLGYEVALAPHPGRTDGGLMVVVSKTCLSPHQPGCEPDASAFCAFMPRPTPDHDKAVQCVSASGFASAVTLADLDEDGAVELIGGRFTEWARPDSYGAAPLLVQGTTSASHPFEPSQQFALPYFFPIAGGIVAVDLHEPCSRTPTVTLAIAKPRRVVTLPTAFEEIASVTLKSAAGVATLIHRAGAPQAGSLVYQTVRGGTWLSFSRPLAAGSELVVAYVHPAWPDLVVSSQSPVGMNMTGSTVVWRRCCGGPCAP